MCLLFVVAGQVWRVILDEIEEAGPYTLTAELDSGTDKGTDVPPRASVSIHSVLFGDVWICAGQDNMQMSTDKVIQCVTVFDVSWMSPTNNTKI